MKRSLAAAVLAGTLTLAPMATAQAQVDQVSSGSGDGGCPGITCVPQPPLWQSLIDAIKWTLATGSSGLSSNFRNS